MEAKKSIYQIITDKFVAQLEQGIVPWHKPWSVGNVGSNELAISYTTRKPYSLLNQMLLGWRGGEYLTFKQIQDLKGQVKKGSKSSMVVFYMPTEKEETDKNGETYIKKYFVLKYYNVFHIEDTTIQSKVAKTETDNTIKVNPIESAEMLIQGYLGRESNLTFVNDKITDKAFFSPSQDLVQVPSLKQYQIVEEYYSTAFHELTHSTLVESRCNRKTNCIFGSEYYAKEELVAEIGSAMLCSLAGIESEKAFSNSVAYVQHWLKVLRNDNRLIVSASKYAESAVKYIANLQD